jgi:hypothetical protein
MTNPKRILITAIMALAMFGALLGAAYYSETLKNVTMTVLSVIGYSGLTVAFYWLLGDSKQVEPTPYVEPTKVYDYAADEAETARDIGRTVDEIMAEVLAENG